MRVDEIEFLARHGVLRDFQLELDRNVTVLMPQSCYTSFLCSSLPARSIPFLPALAEDRVQIPDKSGSAKFVQDEPAERLKLVFRKCCLGDQQHAVKPRVDQWENRFLGHHGINHFVFVPMSNPFPFLEPFSTGVSHRVVPACERSAARPPPWITPSSFHFRPYCIKFRVAVLLVLRCQLSPVSVFARPERLGVQDLQRARGHHSRFVQEICFLPALHGALFGIDGCACWH